MSKNLIVHSLVMLLLPAVLVACQTSSDSPTIDVATATAVATQDIVVDKEMTPSTSSENAVQDVGHTGQPNRLIDEKSPYLQQHAYNPVDWYPWGEEAFAKARAENKPIFLSIGYSTCHWCHVMETESFEDEEVARLMNEAFVSIKVDREERPDIDAIYMNVAMMMNGSGGWPLNIIMTPDQKPFFAATYIPKEPRFGQPGLLDLTAQVHSLWQSEPGNLLDLAERVATAVQQSADTSGDSLDTAVLETTYRQLAAGFDAVHGGFGDAPKFPRPHNLLFLLRYWQRFGDEQALAMVETTLSEMRQGGIYDQVGYGFHRYSTDAVWLTPHFEKMLYDQALLATAYTETYLATGKPEYEQTAREIFTYILRDMTDTPGGFYSAEDADSEGEEGKFYLWTEAEIRELLPPKDADFVITVFNMAAAGNFYDEASAERVGTNILHLLQPLSDADAVRWQLIREELLAVRAQRIRPGLDDKVLTDWNGLMIAALARAAQAFDEPVYAEAAARSADFLLATMRDEDGRLLHRYRDGEAAILATLDDYAFFIAGLIDLYETNFDVRYLENALRLQDELNAHFWDEAAGGFFLTADDAEQLLTRPKEIYDGALPSGNSVAMLDLLRLARITGDATYEEMAAALGEAFAGQVRPSPIGYTQLVTAVDFGVGPSYEVVIAGEPGAADTMAMLEALRGQYLPNKVVLLRPSGDDAPIAELAEFTRFQYSMDDKATAYVCLNQYCNQPTTDVDIMLSLLAGNE